MFAELNKNFCKKSFKIMIFLISSKKTKFLYVVLIIIHDKVLNKTILPAQHW